MKKLLVTAAILCLSAFVFGQSTEFTFQGSISSSGNPANGNHDFDFLLFDSLAGGTQLGTTVSRNGVPVADGLFSVSIDFGDQFPGADRYLEIRVRPSGSGGMTILAPRQKLASVPYAVKSANATNADIATNAGQLGGVAASEYVVTTDPRMTDDRNPLPGSDNYIRNGTTPQSQANFNIGGDGVAGGTLSASTITAGTQFNIGENRILGSGDSSLLSLFVGRFAGTSNPSGTDNTFVGSLAGRFTTSGSGNTFLGALSGQSNIDGTSNTFIGNAAGFRNTSGIRNIYIGTAAGYESTTSTENTFVGINSGQSNISTTGNSFFGAYAGQSNSTGTGNSFFGRTSGANNFGGSSNSFFGDRSGRSNVTGNSNSFFGALAGSDNQTGNSNSFFGAESGENNLDGANNSFFGAFAGNANNSGSNNTFVGRSAGLQNTSGVSNSFLGRSAGSANTIGAVNVFVGSESGQANSTGGANVFVGSNSGDANTTGASNSFIGRDAGDSNTTGSNNSALGRGSDVGSGTLSFATAIGSNAVVTSSNTIQLGRNGTDIVRIGTLGPGGATSLCINGGNDIASCSSSARYKSDISTFSHSSDFLEHLRPVSFRWKDSNVIDLGLVAEEVAEIEPLLVTYRDGVVEGVKYDRIGVVLINVVKEQQKTIEVQGSRLKVQSEKMERQAEELDALKAELEALKALVCSSNPKAGVCK